MVYMPSAWRALACALLHATAMPLEGSAPCPCLNLGFEEWLRSRVGNPLAFLGVFTWLYNERSRVGNPLAFFGGI